MQPPKQKFMKVAIEEALKAKNAGDYAIGAVIIKNNKIIAQSPNRTKTDQDPTQHAEISVIRKAVRKMGSRYLDGCILYTTHEPCPMCSTAIVWAKMEGLVYGCKISDMTNYRHRNGNNEWKWRTINIPASKIFLKSEHRVRMAEGFMRKECKRLFHN